MLNLSIVVTQGWVRDADDLVIKPLLLKVSNNHYSINLKITLGIHYAMANSRNVCTSSCPTTLI